MKCETCKDAKVIDKKGKFVPCPYCMTEEKLVKAIKGAIKDFRKEKNDAQADKLQKVLDFLPDYPVMAIMEAEALDLNPNISLMIRDTFGTLPFGDVSYKKVVIDT